MRDYAKVSPRFWSGKTGKALRGDLQAQVLALYLISSPHSNMIGVFRCPVVYMAHETGLPEQDASKALQRLIEAQFCTFDGDEDMVWVREMAAHQIGEALSPGDKQVKGVRRQFDQIPSVLLRSGFAARYGVAFHLGVAEEIARSMEAPSMSLGSQEQEQEQEQEKAGQPPQAASSIPHKKTTKNTGTTFRDYLADCQQRGVAALPCDSAPFRYAESIGLPEAFLELAWIAFAGRHSSDEKQRGKCYKDWPAVFLNALKGDWYKLWYADGNGTYVLTTAGKQAAAERTAQEKRLPQEKCE